MYSVRHRGHTITFSTIHELAIIAWNTEKIDLLANVDEDTVDIRQAANELQKMYDNIEEDERVERAMLAELACDKELED